MQTLQFENQSLHFGCWVLLTWLLLVPSAHAQEIIQLPDEDRWLEPNFEEVYRIGSLSGEDWEQFGYVNEVAFDGAGQLYVLDSQANMVTVVGPDGGFRRTFGGPGEGPGEFRRALALAVFRDGRVVVGDSRALAYHLFGANGGFERRVSWRLEGDMPVLTGFMPDPSGDRAVFRGGISVPEPEVPGRQQVAHEPTG